MLRIKRFPTIVSNYQKEEAEEGGCGRNCLRNCCLPGAKLPLYAFKRVNKIPCDNGLVDHEDKGAPVVFLDSLLLGEVIFVEFTIFISCLLVRFGGLGCYDLVQPILD